jgi:outer membrane biogenesis lipoprotein LolB
VEKLRPALLLLSAWLLLAGCQTAQQRKAAENAAVNKQAAEEIARICALHGTEREAELKKLKAASGLDLYCPNE